MIRDCSFFTDLPEEQSNYDLKNSLQKYQAQFRIPQ